MGPPIRGTLIALAEKAHNHKEITMSFNHAIVWLDQAEAHVIHFNRDAAESETIKTTSQHKKDGVVGNNRALESTDYMDEVAAALAPSSQILIVGPGQEKLAFIKHLHKSHAAIADKVVSVETVDHPNDGELLEYARKYFVKDNMTN
jgi:stalled ribosome rescue protein Dom34